MKIEDVIISFDEKFTSGNDVQVDRNTITREEYEAVKKMHASFKSLLDVCISFCRDNCGDELCRITTWMKCQDTCGLKECKESV